MPRKKQVNILDNSNELSEKEVYNVMEFAQQMASVYQNISTPDLVNSRLKDVNMNPLAATETLIQQALLNPKDNEKALIGFSEFFEYTDMIYKRMLYYLGNMLSFDINYVCINAETKDYKSKQYKEDEKVLIDFLDKFNIKNEFKKALRQMVRQDSYFCTFREGENKHVLQELPSNYCKITARSEYGFMFDFDMYWFMQAGVNLQMYPPYFSQLYKRVFDGKLNGYNTANSMLNRDGSFNYWVQTSQEEDCWCFKLNQELAGRVPILSPLFNDVVTTPLIRKLQKDKYMLQASKMLFGLVPMLKDNKSGNVKDMMAIDAKTLGQFLGLIRSSLDSVIKMGAAPFDDVKAIDFGVSDQNILEDHNKNMSSSSGMNSRLLYATDKMTSEETRNSISVDTYMMTPVYHQFADFIEFYINKKTKKFKYKITLEGTEFDMDRKNRLENAKELAGMGIVLPQKFSSALNMMPQDLIRQMEMAKASGFSDKLMQMLSMYQQSGKEDKGGRPQSDENEITDSGSVTRSQGTNIEKGGNI